MQGARSATPTPGSTSRASCTESSTFTHHRPLTAGYAVVGTLHVDTVREAGGHAMVTTRTELATEGRARRGLHRHVDHRHPRRRVMSAQQGTPGPRPSAPSPRSRSVTWLPPVTIHIDRARLVAVRRGLPRPATASTGTSGFAKQVGLPDVIAHGMFTMGSAVTLVTDWAGDAGRVVEYGVRFTKPVVVPYDTGADLEVSGCRRVRRPGDQARHRRGSRPPRARARRSSAAPWPSSSTRLQRRRSPRARATRRPPVHADDDAGRRSRSPARHRHDRRRAGRHGP